jgi:integrase
MPRTTPHSASVRIRPRSNGTLAFDVRYRIDGASRSTSFEDQASAERWANIVRHIGPAQGLELLRTQSPNAPTVAEYAERYIAAKSGIEGRTADKYRTYMKTSIGPTLGALPLDAIDRDRIAAWVNQQAAEGSAGKTIANRHGFLSAMYKEAVREGLITRNPCEGTRIPQTERQEMVFLSLNEFETLYAHIPDAYKPFVLTLALTGMRFSEATALKPGDFDLAARTVRVARAWKTSTERGHYVSAPKTRKSRRTVSLPPELAVAVAPLLRGNPEWVFVNRNDGPIRQPTFYMRTWAPAVRAASAQDDAPLTKRPRIHDLRHSHVSWLLAHNVGFDVIQLRLGHESIQTTIGTYGHVAPDRLFAPADVLAGKLTITP